VAKTVILHPVRVLNCSNAGPLSAIIAGVDWVTARVNDQPHAAVANMSLIAGGSTLLDNAVRASVAAGVTYVVAAGNFAADACNYSPARVTEVITVGASTAQDNRAPSSNHGHCVDIYAPGTSIVSTFNRNDSDSVSMSGTSMAAPHVAGIAALLLAQAPDLSPAELADLILGYASVLDHDLDPTGNRNLAYGLIELGDETAPEPEIEVMFDSLCHPRTRQCSFTVYINGYAGEVSNYLWDLGDGTIVESQRPIIRHRYVGTSGNVNVVLGVQFANGHHVIVDQSIRLPF
jgi:serine protease